MKLSKNEKGLENFNFLRYNVYISLLVLVLLIGCTIQEQTTEPTTPKAETPVETAPIESEEPTEDIIKIPNDIKEILEKGKTKLKSYSYNYKSPEMSESYTIHVKENHVKIILSEINTKEQGKFYNTIYLDTEEKTAQAYCVGYSDCEGKVGQVKDLDYPKSYIKTPIDWLEKVTGAQLIDERQVEGRESVYINTNIGKLTIESFYGFLYQIEDGKNKWEFTDVAFNSVKDSDVNIPE